MCTTSHHPLDVEPEDWQQTFARMGSFSLLLFALTAVLQHGPWSRQFLPPHVLTAFRNWALIFLTASLPLYAWHAWIAGGVLIRPIYLGGTVVVFAVTTSLLFSTLTLRALLLGAHHAGHGVALHRSVQFLDLIAVLVLPMLSSFALIMLPYGSQWATQYAVERAGLL